MSIERSSNDVLIAHYSSLIARSSMNGRIFFWSLTSALAGFLFGFDTVVISGAEKTIQALWGLTPGVHGIAMASALSALWLDLCSEDGRPTASDVKPRCCGSECFILSER